MRNKTFANVAFHQILRAAMSYLQKNALQDLQEMFCIIFILYV